MTELERVEVLNKLFTGEWVNSELVEQALEIDHKTGLKWFEFGRIAKWNPPPLNGQKIEILFRLRTAMRK